MCNGYHVKCNCGSNNSASSLYIQVEVFMDINVAIHLIIAEFSSKLVNKHTRISNILTKDVCEIILSTFLVI